MKGDIGMKKKTLKKDYISPQCTVLCEEMPNLLVGSVNMNVGGNKDDPVDPKDEEEETGW